MSWYERVVCGAAPGRPALIELRRDGTRRVWTFAEIVRGTEALSARFAAAGVGRGDVVMTVIGNRPTWVCAMLACFRIGAVALPCSEQLRAHDLELRIAAARPRLVYFDPRDGDELARALGGNQQVRALAAGDAQLTDAGGCVVPPAADGLGPDDPCLITFTSGTSGEAKGVVHGLRYLDGQTLQSQRWLAARPGDLVWCTAASGWSKSARNVFIAPWMCGATALLHDARFDPAERLEIIERERVDVLCMAPTEYRVIANRAALRPLPSLRELVAAGEALGPEVLTRWHEATGLFIRDGYGQTETGQLTAQPAGEPPTPGSMGRALPGVRLWIDDGELVADPRTIPTFFLRYLGEQPPDPGRPWRTGDRVSQDGDGRFHFEGRADDVIISAGYRIGPFEVESALCSHPAVADAAVVAAPDPERGSVVRAVVVLRDPGSRSPALAGELQQHVKAVTAPYKYPRIVEFAESLPKTTSGKIRRAALRAQDGRAPR